MFLELRCDAAMKIVAPMLRGTIGYLVLFTACVLPAQADNNSPSSEALLPYYCQQSFMRSQQGAEFYKGMEGKGPQHYCYGLAKLNKAYMMRGGDERNWAIDSAIGEINYVLGKNPPEDHPVVAEMYLSRGIANRLLGRSGAAAGDFIKAIQIQPKLGKAYVELADFYSGIKQNPKALETVTTGLRHVPGDKSLQRRYKEYGGKPPFPEPLVTHEERKAEPIQRDGKLAVDEGGKKVVAPTPPVSAIPPPEIGSASNPWCRFCPEPSGQVTPKK
jgi:tetratricopeptide (TPR) repeat protein